MPRDQLRGADFHRLRPSPHLRHPNRYVHVSHLFSQGTFHEGCVCVYVGAGMDRRVKTSHPFFSSWPLLLALFRLQSIKHCCVISVYSSRFPPFKNSHLPVFPFPSPILLPPILPGLHPLSSPLSSYIKLMDTPKRIPVLGCPSQTNGMYTKTLYENCLKYFCLWTVVCNYV